jgi:hypothetical protein
LSRHRIPGLNAKHEVWVGWDRPLGSFFGQVYDPGRDEDDTIIHWVGAVPPWLREVSFLVAAMKPYAELTTAMQRRLFDDRELGR